VPRISQISTVWSDLFSLREGPAEAAGEAQRRLLVRYSPAIYNYLLGATRDREVADELFQEFALRLARNDFRRADPRRGRFRDFLKTALCRLVIDHQRRQKRGPLPLSADAPAGGDEPPFAEADRQFLAAWQAELFDQAWEGLARVERQSGKPLHEVLRLRAHHPELSAAQLVERLSAKLGRPLAPEWVYKRLNQARQKFTDLLLGAVARSLEDPTAEDWPTS